MGLECRRVRSLVFLAVFLVQSALAAPFAVQLGDTRVALDTPAGFSDVQATGSPPPPPPPRAAPPLATPARARRGAHLGLESHPALRARGPRRAPLHGRRYAGSSPLLPG